MAGLSCIGDMQILIDFAHIGRFTLLITEMLPITASLGLCLSITAQTVVCLCAEKPVIL